MAAALAIAVLGTGAYLEWQSRSSQAATPQSATVYQTRRGQTATIQLADGSRVRLAPQSQLTIGITFGDATREVSLAGEAEFEVHHDATHPFLVRTPASLIEDIGTRFGVRAYPDDPRTTVAVADGSVALSQARRSDQNHRARTRVLLKAGELGVLSVTGDIATARGDAVVQALAWTRSELVFDRTPLPEVLRTLSRWYDIDFDVVDDAVARHVVTAQFSTQSADDMLKALTAAIEAVSHRQGRRVTLRGRP